MAFPVPHRPLFGALVLAAAVACARQATPEAQNSPAPPLSNSAEPSEKSLESEVRPPEPVPPSPLDAEAPPRIVAAEGRTPAHQSSLAVIGQLATAQALIVSLLLVPFSSGDVAEQSASNDSTVPR
jgi:hypothetical protein